MAEAPRDGTAVLLALDSEPQEFVVGRFDSQTEWPWLLDYGDAAVGEDGCRFWMPIPELPE